MRKIIFFLFLFSLLLASAAMAETADDWLNKADELSDGVKYADPLKAIDYLNKAIMLQPDHAEAYYNRGVAYDNLGQYKAAIRDYNQAIRHKPDYAEAFFNRGVIYNTIGQYQRAIDDFNEAIRLHPRDAEAYLGLGFACDKLGRYQHAIENYTNALGLRPDFAQAYNNRGADYFLLGRHAQGCFDAKRACILGNCKLLQTAENKGICR